MEENELDSQSSPPDSFIPLIRRHAHDVRNGLNGFELEASLLEVLHGDEKTLACIRRMRNQGAAIELAVRFLLNRFTKPDLQTVPAVDVFNLWKSRSKRLPHFETITWTQDIGDALISVDSNMVAEALCESLSYVKGTSIEASVSREGEEILFEIRPRPESPETSLVSVNEWPLMDQLILKNGGSQETVSESGRAISRRFRFPPGKLVLG